MPAAIAASLGGALPQEGVVLASGREVAAQFAAVGALALGELALCLGVRLGGLALLLRPMQIVGQAGAKRLEFSLKIRGTAALRCQLGIKARRFPGAVLACCLQRRARIVALLSEHDHVARQDLGAGSLLSQSPSLFADRILFRADRTDGQHAPMHLGDGALLKSATCLQPFDNQLGEIFLGQSGGLNLADGRQLEHAPESMP